MQRIGVCHFDDAKVASSGWASVAGEESFRVSHRGELSSDVLWITNVLWFDFKRLNLHRKPNYHDEQFFRTSYSLYVKEFGFEEKSPSEKAKFFSNVFNRVSRFLAEKMDIDISNCRYRLSVFLRDIVIGDNHRKRLVGPHALEIENAIKQSTQSIQMMNGPSPLGSSSYNFVFPRGSYSRWIMSQPYPTNTNWEELPKKSFSGIFGTEYGSTISGTKAIVSSLIEIGKKKAVFFRITLLSQSKDYATFQSFGDGSSYSRKWATLPEVLHLSKFSKIKIEGGFSCDLGPLDVSFGVDPKEREFSLTRSIIMDCIWVGLATPIKSNPVVYTAMGAYMRSYDRIACANVSERLFSEGGLTIGSFGTGRVTAFLKPSEIKIANSIAMQSGMVPPLSNLVSERR